MRHSWMVMLVVLATPGLAGEPGHPPNDCTARRLEKGAIEVSCPGKATARFARTRDKGLVADGGPNHAGELTLIEPGSCHALEMTASCLTGQQMCDLRSYINSVPEPWPPWVERQLGLPMCPGESELNCQTPSTDPCELFEQGCADDNPAVDFWRPYLCAASYFCGLF